MIGKHGFMPSPRGGFESHHGMMSKWMEAHYPNYNPDEAPAILMPTANHNATRAYFNKWRMQMKATMGGVFDWAKVSEAEMRQLANDMMDVAQVSPQIKNDYWKEFENYLRQLRR